MDRQGIPWCLCLQTSLPETLKQLLSGLHHLSGQFLSNRDLSQAMGVLPPPQPGTPSLYPSAHPLGESYTCLTLL